MRFPEADPERRLLRRPWQPFRCAGAAIRKRQKIQRGGTCHAQPADYQIVRPRSEELALEVGAILRKPQPADRFLEIQFPYVTRRTKGLVELQKQGRRPAYSRPTTVPANASPGTGRLWRSSRSGSGLWFVTWSKSFVMSIGHVAGAGSSAYNVFSFNTSRSVAMPPNTIAPSRPLPKGSAPSHFDAG